MKPALVVVGLGNPGTQYERTRHNIGFQAVDAIAKFCDVGDWEPKDKFRVIQCEARIVAAPVLLVKPQTYMNDSGTAIRKIVDFYKLNPADQLLVICDDIDLPLAQPRLRHSGGPGTHNGLKSIVALLGEEFTRLRIGLGTPPAGMDLANWVLSIPSAEEQRAFEGVFATLPEVLKTFVLGSEDGSALR